MLKSKIGYVAVIAILAVYAVSATLISLNHDWTPDSASAQATGAVPLGLLNGGFEAGFREVDGVHELKVADDWDPWWDERAARPEYKRADPTVDARRVRSGNSAQQWFNNYATHTAGVLQRVENIPVGATMTLEAWVQAFSSGKDDFSQSAGKYRMRIGIDPYGGLDPESPDVVWSNDGHAIEPYDEYKYLAVSVPARSDRATIFIWGQAEWALKHNNAYVDDVRVWATEGPNPTACPPTPIVTPCPTCPPGTSSCPSLEAIRGTIREELNKTKLTGE
jgi:hypothetical protein